MNGDRGSFMLVLRFEVAANHLMTSLDQRMGRDAAHAKPGALEK